jgi:hypothetical protein
LTVGKFDGVDAKGEGLAAVKREVGGAGEFEAALEFGELMTGEVDADTLPDGNFPEGGDVGVES